MRDEPNSVVAPDLPQRWEPQTLLDAQAMAHVGVWEWEMSDGEVRWSPELCRIYGFDPEGFTHDFGRFLKTVVPEDRAQIKDAMRNRTDFDFELRIVGEDGRARTLHAVCKTTVDPVSGEPVRILGTTQDITERKLAEQRLRESEVRFRAAFEDAPIGMVLVDLDGNVLRVNAAVSAMLGRRPEDLMKVNFQDITHPDDLAADLEQFNELLDGSGDGYSLEKRYLRPDGESVWTRLSVSLVRDPQGSPSYFVSQIQDISEEKRLREHLHRLADHDALTGLHNRRRFDEDLAAQAARARRYKESAAVILLDLNDFKRVNDTHGHHEGDQVLQRVASAIRTQSRDSDSAARIGGDEFAVLLIKASLDEAERVAEGLAVAVRDAAGHGVSASVGVAIVDRWSAPQRALQIADKAMYAAKAALRERTLIPFVPEPESRSESTPVEIRA